jgi:glycosyltransferase involved in cell wall biosynthesis
LRLGVDAREIQDGVYTGIGRPLFNFLKYFSVQENDDTCVLFSSKEIEIDLGPKISKVVMPQKSAFVWDQCLLPQAMKKAGVDLFYSPYYKIPLLKPCRSVSAILDLMYIAYGPYYKEMSLWRKFYYAIFGRSCAHRADKVLTCSQHSKNDIKRIYGVHEARIKVIPLSVASFFFTPHDHAKVSSIRKKFNISGRYILYVGNFKPHKNIDCLIHAFAAVAMEFPDAELVLAGPKEHAYKELVKMVQDHQLSDRVIFTDKIVESDGLQYLYQGAEIFVMPSFYEGFGIPPIEAMACGVPVVASSTTSIPEIVGDAGILVDPCNPSGIVVAIRKILLDPKLKQELIDKGTMRARAFESEKIAKEMYDFLKTEEGPHP